MREHEQEWLELCREAAVEQDPDKLLRLVQRINELLEAKQNRLGPDWVKATPTLKDVFQIAYDKTLLEARAKLLRNRGYQVSSVLGNAEARRLLAAGESYRIFIVGHAAPQGEREHIVAWLKSNFPRAKILALNPPHNGGLDKADFNFVLNGPEEWLFAVDSVARQTR